MSGFLDARPTQAPRLAARSVGTFSSTVFSLASTAPAYSLAVTVGLLASYVGGWSPLLLAAAAVPVAAVVLCFGELNRAEPDCGTCYAWTARAFGPRAGWLAGWVAIAACALVMTNLLQTAAIYGYTVVGADGLASSRVAQALLGTAVLVAMAYLAHLGITVAARVQIALLAAEVAGLLVFIVRAVTAEPLPEVTGAPTPALSGVVSAFLVAIFLYWGWDSSFSVNEESEEPVATPARAALLALGCLVLLYAGFCWAATFHAGATRLAEVGEDDLFAVLAEGLMGSTGGTLLVGAVLVSALASAQTTILPSARSAFSMARRGHLPGGLASVSATGSPSRATAAFTVLAAAVYLALLATSDAVLADTVAATAILVSAYYAATCAAVPFFFRGARAARPVRRLVVPALATVIFTGVLALSLLDASPVTVVAVAVVAAVGVGYVFSPSFDRRSTR